ncbi:hypothetical protein BUALT_Bualt04G0010700 [Buddleja alternifolia]|uniref:TFIIS N-terminal domain-containing protein n=1 Tax=Buddleja alternifolia TaxID=168488 RepID=A0AAV6XLP5_9LAMI|nr:hypothetical protein BUALT_Bualt04G0010700 [Buddleja alternifolia]
MDTEEVRSILSRSRVEIWALIETAIKVAAEDHGDELRRRRDRIVESLYTPPPPLCQNCSGDIHVVQDEPYYPQSIISDGIGSIDNINLEIKNKKTISDDDDNNNDSNMNLNEDFGKSTPLTPESDHRSFSGGDEEEDVDPYGGLFDDEQTKILSIKEQLEDPDQSEDAVVDLLQNLADMDITFQALKETDIGRHVNRLRKHTSNEVRRLVKQLVRKWKETVDEWVKVPDFGYSPNPRNGSSSVERNYAEHETKPRPPQSAPRREAPSRPPQSVPKPASAPSNRAQKEPVVDDERLNSARKRLQENYQEAQNAKKQRTIQVMDIHEIPRPKNAFFSKNKGGFQGRHHR